MAVQAVTKTEVDGGILVEATLANGDKSDWFTLGGLDASTMLWRGTVDANKAWQLCSGTVLGVGGSVQLEYSIDGANSTIVGAARTSLGIAAFTANCRYFRWNCTAGDGTTSMIVKLFVPLHRS